MSTQICSATTISGYVVVGYAGRNTIDYNHSATYMRPQTDLTSALEGAYAYSSYLPKAPDPEIHIAGKGRVMLPLDASFAEKLITRVSMEKFWSLQIKYSNQGLTHWEAGADEVTFGNAAWAEYVHGVARTVSAALGIAQSVSTPKCVFRKLIVQKEGARYAYMYYLKFNSRRKLTTYYGKISSTQSVRSTEYPDLKVPLTPSRSSR